MFYFSLANLEPRLRSLITSIHLVAVVKKDLIDKYGVNVILEPFVKDVMQLEQVRNYW